MNYRWSACLLAVVALGVCLPTSADSVRVELTGLSAELKANAQAFLTIVSETKKPDVSLLKRIGGDKSALGAPVVTEQQLVRWHKLADEEIRQALQPFGYYNAVVEGELKRTPKTSEWRANYLVNPGKRSRWREVTLSVVGAGAEDAFVRALGTTAVVREGKKINHATYDQYKRVWLARMFDEGYLDARFLEAQFTVDTAANRADVCWKVDTGPKYKFGKVTVDQDVLKSTLVDGYHAIKPGDTFDTRRLIDLQLKLNNSNYFETVSLDIRRDEAVDHHIPVVMATTPRKRRRYNLGVGFGTDTGPRATAGIESRRVNKRGHRYRVNGRVSAIESSLQFEYDIPIKDVSKDRWRFFAQLQQSDVGDADATQYLIGAAREDGWFGMRRRMFVNAERSNFQFGDEPSRSATLVYPGITLSFDRLDNPSFVRKGFSLAGTVQGGADAVGSATDFVSVQLSGRGILPLGKRGRLLGAVDARTVEAGDFSALPPSQRFFLGGDRSVRGYAFQSISPENSAGDDIGGSNSFSFNLEADYQVKGNFGLAAFFDAGDVSDGSPTDFKKGVGLGFRYRSAVGMIRFDLAHPLDDPDTNVRVHLSIGADL